MNKLYCRSNISHPYSVNAEAQQSRPQSAQSGRNIAPQTPQVQSGAQTPYRLNAPYSQPTFHKQDKPAEVGSRTQNGEAAMNSGPSGQRTPPPSNKNLPVPAYRQDEDLGSPADSKGHHHHTPPYRGDYTPQNRGYDREYQSPDSVGSHHRSETASRPNTGRRGGSLGALTFEEIKDHITQSLKQNQATYFGLEKVFVIADTHKNRVASREKLQSCLQEVGVRLSPQELEIAFDNVAQGNASVNYLDFIAACRGQMSPQRESAVEQLFKKLGNPKTQEINTNSLVARLRPERHVDGNPQKVSQ